MGFNAACEPPRNDGINTVYVGPINSCGTKCFDSFQLSENPPVWSYSAGGTLFCPWLLVTFVDWERTNVQL